MSREAGSDDGDAASTGRLASGHPYVRVGRGRRQVLVIPGIELSGDPPRGLALKSIVDPWRPYLDDVTAWWIGRPPGLRRGTTLREIAHEYARVIRTEMEPPVAVIGFSTGGAIAQYLAADHAPLIDRLVLAMTAHRLSPLGRRLQGRFGHLLERGKWRRAYALLGGFMFPRRRRLMSAAMWLIGPRMFGRPRDVSVALVDVDAEDAHDFKERLGEITTPTLALSAELDEAYPTALVREMVAAMPDARHIEYRGVGHMGPGAPLMRDAVDFLLARPPTGSAETA